MSFATVDYQVSGGVGRITLNRPEKHNALNHALLDDLDAAFERAERDDAVRVVVLAGAGRSFCAGYDLDGSYYTKPPEPEGRWTLANAVAADDANLGHPAIRMGGVSSMPLWQVLLGPRVARYLLLTGRTVSGVEAARLGLVTLAVPAESLDATVDGIVADCLQVPFAGALHAKEALNTALEIQGVGALFRYHGQMNALGRLDRRDPF